MRNIWKKPDGLGLVQVLFLMGFISILSVGVVTQMNVLSRTQQTTLSSFQVNSLVAYLRTMIASDNSCGVALGIIDTNGKVLHPLSVNLPAVNSGRTSIAIYDPLGNIKASANSPNNNLDSRKISALDLVVSGNPKSNGTGNFNYQAVINLSVAWANSSIVNFGSANLFFSMDLNVQIDPSGVLVGCSYFKNGITKSALPNACSNIQAAQVNTSNEIVCTQVLCDVGSIPNGYDSKGNLTCLAVSKCTGPGYGVINVSGQFMCELLVCPLHYYPDTVNADGFPSSCNINLNFH